MEFVRPAGLAGTVPYAYAAVVGPGRAVFTAGACPLDAAGQVVGAGEVVAQAEQVMANLGTLLGVQVLGYPDQLVEVEAIAFRPDR